MPGSPILFTGAAQRVGLYCVKALHAQGHQLVVSYRTRRDSINALEKLGIDCIQADFASDEGIHGFVHQVKSRYVSLRAIVHNASDWLPDDNLRQAQIFDTMMAVHAKAPLLINQALAPLLNQDKADIIHLTDFVAQTGSAKHMAYAASKAALENLTMSFARALAPRVKVNAIAPALICFNKHDDEAYRQKTLKKSLLGTEPGEQEVFKAISWLLDSDYMTGRIIGLDGGRPLNLP
ncbi:dihydromonapterin reductase [Aliiglaciecola sp. CAU 1673]|uniref:dihydromonapterin reductase n=1 Tax=Aliiglaciecola sp. CAU 1673 TaxID=3032595 RepID=UPI0023DB6A86|nr:dihydromonapterin reductase [Aliiglaciecola sp. CAU 1673]MDF2178357.1 dihydromonapterin reductase [Aliiglaciecola sp. CAU 1673]